MSQMLGRSRRLLARLGRVRCRGVAALLDGVAQGVDAGEGGAFQLQGAGDHAALAQGGGLVMDGGRFGVELLDAGGVGLAQIQQVGLALFVLRLLLGLAGDDRGHQAVVGGPAGNGAQGEGAGHHQQRGQGAAGC